MAVGKQIPLMFMLASFASAGLAIVMTLGVGDSSLLLISAPGFIIGTFFAYKYFSYDRNKEKEEEHRRKRHKH
ncbi:hypothetical protein [Nitrososphaera sp.]|uniref:hypothetical protein n=1 Tax=Nitrososphaera sp. TaxID=1971748 RepID=UPI00317E69D1